MRRRFTEADRRRFYAELERSGESAWRVAHRLGLNPNTAYRWVAGREVSGPVFAKVVRSKPEPQRSAIAIEVGSVRVVVDGAFDPDVLRAVVNALSGDEQ
jgi:transposase-like protein